MLVPAVFAASTSPSPTNVPAVIFTVAFVRVWLSGSDSARLGAMVSVWPRWNGTRVGTEVSVGRSLTAVMPIVVVALVTALLALPSLRVQTRVRLGFDPKL